MKTSKPIIIVSGLPRSGTSLMMQMLAAAGIPILSDAVRQADTNNPNGYFELEIIKNLQDDNSCIQHAQGKAVKVISHLLKFLPQNFEYKIIFIQRNLPDVIRSQNRMLRELEKDSGPLGDEVLVKVNKRHLDAIKKWLQQQHNIQTIEITYEELLDNSEGSVKRIVSFLELELKTGAMIQVVDQSLNHSD